ncbi:ATP-binding protein [candidate division KSB1 bacterium]|nr:ATP-binding protein [candidate division KSB1 bacterium]
MHYVTRTIEAKVRLAAKQFPVIAVTGPRQAGKSTLLLRQFSQSKYFTFDDPVLQRQAKDDPGLFVENVPPFSVLDEVQYVPELLPYLKIQVDRNRTQKGRYLLTGSQIFHLMAGLTESLAGRIALFELLPFSLAELEMQRATSLEALFERLYNGFYPDPAVHGVDAKIFYGSYLHTYVERDVRQINLVKDLSQFQRFMELLAARAGAILNVSDLARDCGLSHTTAQHWLSLLETSRIIFLLRPYFKNIGKRVIKAPKLYFVDTGLLAYLLKYPDHKTLQAGPVAAQIFENCLIVELLKEKLHGQRLFELYYYRDTNKNEIDLIVEEARRLHLVEIKMRKNINADDARTLDKFESQNGKLHRWLISCSEHEIKLTASTKNLPWWKIHTILT